jgi:hypothetical protein
VHQTYDLASRVDEIDGDAIGHRDREDEARLLRQVSIGHEVGAEPGLERFMNQDLRSVHLPGVDQ